MKVDHSVIPKGAIQAFESSGQNDLKAQQGKAGHGHVQGNGDKDGLARRLREQPGNGCRQYGRQAIQPLPASAPALRVLPIQPGVKVGIHERSLNKQ